MPSSLITPSQITALQAISQSLLPDSCVILRRSTTPDGRGGRTDTWAAVGSPVACRVTPGVAGSEQAAQERFQTASPFTVVLPAGTDVREPDRLVITSLAGKVLEVKDSQGARSYEVSRMVFCIEVTA